VPYFDIHHCAHRLVIARLTGNPNFEAIVKQLDHYTIVRRDGSRERYIRLVPYLREHAKMP
jgi:hypothetical protein